MKTRKKVIIRSSTAKRSTRPRTSSESAFHNIHHPDYAGKLELAFSDGGVDYYTFKNDLDTRTGRHMVIQNFLQEVNLRMDPERLKTYINTIRAELDGSKGTVNVGNAIVYLEQMKSLTELAFEPDTVYRLASAIYFDATEDITTWDKEHNDKKIKGWKESGTLGFFYRKPLSELIGLKDISEDVLRDYLEKVRHLSDAYNTALNSATPAP